MNEHLLPALDGRTALGWLASLGLLRLLDEESQDPRVAGSLLAWDPTTAQARLSVPGTFDDVVGALVDIVSGIPDGALLPDGPTDFPGSKAPDEWPRGDPVRMPRPAFRPTVEEWRSADREVIDRWLPAMVTDQVVDDMNCVSLSTYAAPSGQQKFSTMFGKTLELVREKPDRLRDALVSWRRVDGVTGEYLDHRVLRSAADTTIGKSNEAGVPGATWLALMALPWLSVRGWAGEPLSTCWQPRRRQRPVMVWPLWRDLLPPPAVRALLGHPALRVSTAGRTDTLQVDSADLTALSVFAVGAAERQSIAGRNFAGVLAPVEVIMA